MIATITKSAASLTMFGVLALFASGCSQQATDADADAPTGEVTEASHDDHDHDDDHSGWWCTEHGIPEEQCSLCSADAAEACQANRVAMFSVRSVSRRQVRQAVCRQVRRRTPETDRIGMPTKSRKSRTAGHTSGRLISARVTVATSRMPRSLARVYLNGLTRIWVRARAE